MSSPEPVRDLHGSRQRGAPAQRRHAADPRTRSSGGAQSCDVFVVGGGINGAGIARDLAGRGASVMLCEKDDLAQHTSSSSTKLIHGGLRYLEYYEFSLVRKALAEREVLLKSAPHVMWPLRFVMPHDPSMRPVWMIRIGLFLYDHLARREVLPASQTVDLRRHPAGKPLKRSFTKGFVYSDGWVDDARLVVLNAIDAAEHGATILTRWRCVDARRSRTEWQLRLESADGERREVTREGAGQCGRPVGGAVPRRPRAPAAREVAAPRQGQPHRRVRRLFDHDHAYIFQNPDKRIIFAIPYEARLHADRHDRRRAPRPDRRGRDRPVRDRLPVRAGEPVFRAAGQRARRGLDLFGRAPAARRRSPATRPPSRATTCSISTRRGAPLLTVWGGKITTFRKLAEEAADQLADALPASKRRTGPTMRRCRAAT